MGRLKKEAYQITHLYHRVSLGVMRRNSYCLYMDLLPLFAFSTHLQT